APGRIFSGRSGSAPSGLAAHEAGTVRLPPRSDCVARPCDHAPRVDGAGIRPQRHGRSTKGFIRGILEARKTTLDVGSRDSGRYRVSPATPRFFWVRISRTAYVRRPWL